MLILDLYEVQNVLPRSSQNCLLDLADIKTDKTHSFFFFYKNLVGICYAAGTVLGAVDKAVNERDKVPFLTRLTF